VPLFAAAKPGELPRLNLLDDPRRISPVCAEALEAMCDLLKSNCVTLASRPRCRGAAGRW